MTLNKIISRELSISSQQVDAVVQLLDEGATIPFISRYRKEKTGSLDEVVIANIRDRMEQLRELEARRETILNSIDKQEKLTPELRKSIEAAETMAQLEDIYLPYKPKRKTRASMAREKGLDPLAELLFAQNIRDVMHEASAYISEEKGVTSVDEALKGARDIIAEWVNEDASAREKIRRLFEKEAVIYSRVLSGKEQEGQKYRDYFDWSEPLNKVPSHRLLAMRRGEKEMILSLTIAPDEQKAVELLERQFVSGAGKASEQVSEAVKDAFKRLMQPSLETEMRINSKNKADEEAIRVFAENMRQLLLTAPLGQKRVMALDPGFRTGCKLVVLDSQGKLLENTAIYPNQPQNQQAQAASAILTLVKEYKVEAIAIGNGTASRETETFVRSIGLPESVLVVMVNESGASIYSASAVAREEFPDQDVTVRGAVSIGRRLMDPLAELVKIDPKSIGVGQYQHDVDQNLLKKSLDDVVMSCVNSVGVELNTASKELLAYVSGLGPQLAQNIVTYRNEYGAFQDREALKKVTRLGGKSFEQAAGFLRINSSRNPLDNSGVHPESYPIVTQMAKDLNCTIHDLMEKKELREKIDLKKYMTDTVGLPTLEDIMKELAQPGRDPREGFEAFKFEDSVQSIADLKVGMKLPGVVTNITNFGAFVDIGVHQDGLVHISHLADTFVKNPADIVSIQQQVEVTVTEVDPARKRIALSMKKDPFGKSQPSKNSGKSAEKSSKKEAEGDFQEKLRSLQGKFGK
jgi:uncharacterized protein